MSRRCSTLVELGVSNGFERSVFEEAVNLGYGAKWSGGGMGASGYGDYGSEEIAIASGIEKER